MNNKDDTVRGSVKRILENILEYSVENTVGDIVWHSVEISVWNTVFGDMWRYVGQEMVSSVRNPVRRAVSDYFEQNEN